MPLATTTAPYLWALLGALPWLLAAPFLAFRMRGSPSLADLDNADLAASTGGAPVQVSVILPARNEAEHIAECVRSIRASDWPRLQIIVVDDSSTDGTGALARSAANSDARVQVIDAPPLADGWFGKQWACRAGAEVATGDLLLFTDADTRHAPDLVRRMVCMHAKRRADLLSVAGRQDMESFWERAVQPLMFTLILVRYGGTRDLERARRAQDVVANGQCFMMSRARYDALGGHARVRDYVAEDLMMAQAVWEDGGRVSLAFGRDQLRTRMYDGLGPLIRGWAKNVYAGGRHAMRGGAIGRALYPVALLSAPLTALVPFTVLLVSLIALLAGAPGPFVTVLALWGALASAGLLVAAAAVNRYNGDPWYRAPYAIPGALMLFVICCIAIVRGDSVSWKSRRYVAK